MACLHSVDYTIVIVFLMPGLMGPNSSGVTTNKSHVKSDVNEVIN